MTGLEPGLSIETERLLLRAHRSDDLDDLVAFHSDPDVVEWALARRRAAN